MFQSFLSIAIGLPLGAIAFFYLLAPAAFNRQPSTVTPQAFTSPDSARAIAIDPVTQAVTLEAIDSD